MIYSSHFWSHISRWKILIFDPRPFVSCSQPPSEAKTQLSVTLPLIPIQCSLPLNPCSQVTTRVRYRIMLVQGPYNNLQRGIKMRIKSYRELVANSQTLVYSRIVLVTRLYRCRTADSWLLTPTRVTRVKRSSMSVCVCGCVCMFCLSARKTQSGWNYNH